ncbi:ArsI/CadI family heavy metal resistance metalloenzyme [Pontibacter chinhatensis]|uniref:Catechol 2,3-dioxygenase n=1 Tax=Pontibacter chinhatensis TaxID=1436961 RepID=A0A1I2MNZ9_9BACT|nr:ArsI/CadI family heavy metal resistance metalloenzyme [Pontibacter chinhatensis]SFF91207.1 Catechol 2,3-dioxygenase [Pontibacter chinhatensis]
MNTPLFPRMHVSLYVSDIQKITQFYTSFFGQEPVKVKPNYAKYVLEQPSLIISFVENPERVQAHFGHMGFQVETKQELEQRLEVARAKGLVMKEEIGTACCYAVQDKFWVEDPDGVQWEVYYFHEDAEFNDPHYESADASACCMPPAQEQKPKVQLTDISIMTDFEGQACTPGSGCC